MGLPKNINLLYYKNSAEYSFKLMEIDSRPHCFFSLVPYGAVHFPVTSLVVHGSMKTYWGSLLVKALKYFKGKC